MTAPSTGKSSPKAAELRKATLAERRAPVAPPPPETYGEVLRLPLASVVPSPDNPRKRFIEESLRELADSMLENGVIQPIVVRELTAGTWQIVAGERRWRAAKLAHLTHIPAVLSTSAGSIEAQAARLIENVQREDLAPIEKARAFKQLLEVCGTQTEAARRVGISQSRFAHGLALLKLPDAVQDLLAEGKLSGAHGEVLARWADFPAFISVLAEVAVAQEPPLSARELAHPFDFDNVLDDERFEPLYDGVAHAVMQRAGCGACPWKAFIPDTQRNYNSTGWCLRPEHIKEVEAELREDQHLEAKHKQAETELSRAAAVAAVRAAGTVVETTSPTLDVGDRVRHPLLGESSVLEAKPHALLLRSDDGGKEIWIGRNGKGGAQLEVLDNGGKDASTHTETAPQLDYNKLPHGTAELLRYAHPLPAPCKAETCECFGRVRYYSESNVGVCTQPARLRSLQTKTKAARTTETKRRHAEAVALLAEAIEAIDHIGPRELAVLGHAASSRDSTYRPNGTSWTEMWKVAGIRVLRDSASFTQLADVENEVALTRALVEAVLLQDLALRFHPDGGRTYGWLAAQYIGQPIPEACADDWSPAEKGVVP